MIAALSSRILQKYTDRVVVDVSGVGYEVYVTTDCIARLPDKGDDIFLHIHTYVREDTLVLFGFLEEQGKELFLMLKTVAGVGPKLALAMLSGMAAGDLCQAIAEGDSKRLTALPGYTVPAGNGAPTARFEGGRVSGFSGCNRFTGGYTVDRDRLTIGNLAGTMMACPEPAMAVEKAFLSALSGTLAANVADNRLNLTPAAGGNALQFELEPKPSLAGVNWEVTGFNNGRQAVVGPLLGTQLTIAFKDGKVSGSGGCNSFHGPFKVDGNALSIGPLATTRKLCAAEGVMAQEREFIAALQTATTWAIDRGMLDVHRKDGERVLTASEAGE